MSKKNTPKLKLSIILSIMLHLGVLVLLAYSAFTYIPPIAGDNGNAIDAIMVDPKIVTEQYQRQMQQKTAVQEAEKQRQLQSAQRTKELQERQAAEQQRIKALEKERLQALSKQAEEIAATKAAQQAKQRAEEEVAQAQKLLVAQQTRALAEKQRIEEERIAAEAQKQKAVEEAQKAKAEAEQLKQKVEEVKKQEEEKQRLREAAEKQKVADEAKRQTAINDILGDLTASTPKTQQGVSSTEMARYKTLVYNAINNKFVNSNSYRGKSCLINITIARDGLVLTVSGTDGDPILCREAISATKLAVIPKPTSDALYQEVKSLTIEFKPR